MLSGPAETAGDISASDLREGQLLWATLDAPWLHKVDATLFAASLNEVRKMDPEMILSSHLPPARRMTEQLLSSLAAAPAATPFVGPDQEALQQMLAQVIGNGTGAKVPA